MISDEFNDGNIISADFGAKLKGEPQLHFVPANDRARGALKQMMRETVATFDGLDMPWEELDISEDYGDQRRIFAPRNSEYMADIAPYYDVGALPELTDLPRRLPRLEAYFAVFRDDQGRKAVGIKKATQFKATLGAEGKLLRLSQDTLTLIDEKVVRLDPTFDAIVTAEHVYILSPRRIELLGNYAEKVAATAEDKVQRIHDTVAFLDLSRIRSKIKAHPRMARLAASVSLRADLADTQMEYVTEHARLQGIPLKEIDGRLRCNVAHEMKLLEILDRRRYHVKLTPADPEPFRATARQRVANGSMSSSQSGEGDIRKALVEADQVDCMVALPGQLFYSTAIPACLWFLARDKSANGHRDRRGEVLFIDARKLGHMVDRTRREFADADIQTIADTYHRWRGKPETVEGSDLEPYTDQSGFCRAVSLEEIRSHGHVLTPGRYVGATDVEDDGVGFEERIAKLREMLTEQFETARRLEARIETALGDLAQ